MRRLPAILALVFSAVLLSLTASAQEEPSLVVKALNLVLPGTIQGDVQYDQVTDMFHGTNGIYVNYTDPKHGTVVLTADSATLDRKTGLVVADGHVRIESGEELWVGEHITYNLKTHQMQSSEFRTGKPPVFAAGTGLTGGSGPKVFTGSHVYVTGDDVSDPPIRVKASKIKIVSNKSVEMWNAVVWAEGVPVFYFPYYKRNLGLHANNLNILPGYRSKYGAFLLNDYTWYLNDEVDGKVRLDYRTRRGVGTGPDLNLHFGPLGRCFLPLLLSA